MKIIALDIGDVWTGSAISDQLGIIATPLKTVLTKDLAIFMRQLIDEKKIGEVVVGYPKTMRGTESEQTRKILSQKEFLEKAFPELKCLLWDERLTSQHAQKIQSRYASADKLMSHSVAAALILSGYLDSQRFHNHID